MREVILIKNGEIALKGLNRKSFENRLIKNIKYRLSDMGKFVIGSSQSTIYIRPQFENCDMDEVSHRISKVFGIAAYSRSLQCDKDYEQIEKLGLEYLKDTLSGAKSFKVVAKRSDKSFFMTSPDICREFGGHILQNHPHLTVDLHSPDVTVMVEIRDYAAYVHADQLKGAGGLPVGTSGRAMLLISGGIDSPVAGYLMARRGIELFAVHFESPPYTSLRAKLKVEKLISKMSHYSGRVYLHTVNFTEIQEKIRDNCREDFLTIIMRRFMMKVAERIALENHCGALITGESVAQVASQTMMSLQCTNIVVEEIPVFRPLIGLDKLDIIDLSKKIDTFETSTLPYEDCCTVFTPKHPKTKPRVSDILREEEKLDVESLIQQAINSVEVKIING